MDPAMMYGMVSEHDEEEDETFDLSGWMSRSAPELGSPMINEPTVRPRGGSAAPSDNVMASASIASGPEPQFTSRPRSNPSNLGYTIGKESKLDIPLNPLYAHDDSKVLGFTNLGLGSAVGPRAVAAIKTGAITTLILRSVYNRGFPGRRTTVLAGLAYLHPVLGINHGYFLPSKTGTVATVGKVVIHGALAAFVISKFYRA
tara:strand:+ start:7689 stop:8294 length:606 start_codon:yes stop_codon:yes gene_type:complete